MAKIKLYQQIANDLTDQISQGIFPPGSKLPSIRTLATQKSVSISSVQKALEELESIGLVEAKPKSGFYVRLIVDAAKSYETPMISSIPKNIKVHEIANQVFHQCEESNVADLGVGYPHVAYGAHKQLQKIAIQVIRKQMKDVAEVHFASGHPSLRKVLAKRLNQIGCRLNPEDLIVTNGCLEALSICLKAVAKPGDTIAVESPGFVGLFQVLESLGYKALEIPCHATDGMSLEALELALEQWDIKAVAIVPTFSNPLGTNMPLESRKVLVELLAQRNIPLIENDLLAELSFDGSRTQPCKVFDKKGLVLYCSSASKTIAPGFRVGWIVPGIFYKEVSYFKTFTNINASSFSQLVIAEFLKSGRYDRHLRQLSSSLAKRMYRFQQLIQSHFPEGTKISYPGGGCLLWVGLPNSIDGFDFFKQAIQLGIAIIPGQLSSGSKKFNNCIRINCACDPDINTENTIKKLAQLAFNMMSK